MHLSFYKLMKGDEECEAIYQTRLSRLGAMRGSSANVNDAAELAISLTNSAHSLAGTMALYKAKTRAAATPERHPEDAILAYRKAAASTTTEEAPSWLEETESAQQKAYSFFKCYLRLRRPFLRTVLLLTCYAAPFRTRIKLSFTDRIYRDILHCLVSPPEWRASTQSSIPKNGGVVPSLTLRWRDEHSRFRT
jgi:hypothetical protein